MAPHMMRSCLGHSQKAKGVLGRCFAIGTLFETNHPLRSLCEMCNPGNVSSDVILVAVDKLSV